jgi:hypothetical protein
MKTFPRLLWLPLLFLLLAGCSPVVTRAQEAVSPTPLLISASQAAGQTFTSHQAGLQGLEVFLQPSQPGTGQVVLRIYAPKVGAPFNDHLLAQASISLSSVAQPGWYRFDFEPRQGSNMQDYAFSLQVVGDGQVGIGNAPGNTYWEGSAYLESKPADNQQLAFRTVYRARWMVLGLLSEGLTWLKWLALAIFAFVLPGWAIMSGLWAGWKTHSWGEKLGLAIGLSLAIYPLILLWTDLTGLHLGVGYAVIPPVAAIVFLAWKNFGPLRHFFKHPVFPKPRFSRTEWGSFIFHTSAFFLTTTLIFLVRFYVVRTISMPLWGDSYQHTLIAQLIVDHNGLFQSWQPYTSLQTLSYHFGFHTAVAVFHWLTHLDLAQAMIWFGQILNGLAIIALYPLAVRVSGGNRWAGIGAMLVAGLLSALPMIYTNWGRYTQLAGQTILPVAACLGWTILESFSTKSEPVTGKTSTVKKTLTTFLADWRSLIPASLAMAGLALTHYRILIFAALLYPIFLIFELRKSNWKPILIRLCALTLLSGILVLPWYIRTYGSGILRNLTIKISTSAASISNATLESNAISRLDSFFPILLWLLLFLAVAWCLWKRSRRAAFFSAWWLLILLATNPVWLHLPGTGVVTNFTLLIAIYIPAGVLLGAAAVTLVNPEQFSPRGRFWGSLCLWLVVAGLGLWGINQRRNDISVGSGALALRPDMRAAEWIQSNTPTEAGFLVNSFFAYSGSSIVGADGGWWLPYLAHRQTNLPPLTYSSEQGPRPDYIKWVNAFVTAIDQKGIADSSVLAELKARGLSYIYIGQQQGMINNPNPLILDPLKLSTDSHFRTVYHQDRVWIFEIVTQ